ncbi:ATP-binding cassette (ABC) Superfamily [Phytophthora palmivora]|uniref:ATP-binding cassette (ABC) Superfamily n=1 Tax=Phytophthora palmivora TaxID=4796 RepID=A0A2P4XUL5_9STRA|nr:ATP-binding cassette (ABC) Superfamily [Phytophthora palmivora]
MRAIVLCCSSDSSETLRPLAGGHTFMSAYERQLTKGLPLFLKNIAVARLLKKAETKGGLYPVWGFPWVYPENTSSVAQGCPVKELQGEAQLVFTLIQRDLPVEFAHLVAKRQLVTKMKSGLPTPMSSVTWDNLATSLAGISQGAAALGLHAPHGRGAHHADQGGKPSPALKYEDEVRQLRDRIYAIEIALDIGIGCQAATLSAKPTAIRQAVDALSRETQELDGRVDRRIPVSVLKELRRGLDALDYEAHG